MSLSLKLDLCCFESTLDLLCGPSVVVLDSTAVCAIEGSACSASQGRVGLVTQLCVAASRDYCRSTEKTCNDVTLSVI